MPDNTTDKKNSSVVVCILFFEKVDQTIECIRSFLSAQVPIIVCNNGSSPASRQKLIDFIKAYPRVQLIETSSNLGVSGGRNFILRSAKADWLFFIDNDITIQTAQWLLKFQRHLQFMPEAEVFIPQLYNVFERTYTPRYNLQIKDNKVSFSKRASGREMNMFPGGASLVKRILFDRIGTYDERIFVEYEDYELCLRAVLSGNPVRAYKIEDILLNHNHRQAANESDRAYVSIRYDHNRTRSSAQRVFEKHHLHIQDDSFSWVEKQKHNLLHGRKWWSKETLYLLIPAAIKKMWNNRK